MNSSTPGKSISEIEVTNISSHGLWLYVHDEELFMSYEDFPWFKGKTLEAVLNVEEVSLGHYYWPKIDIDLTKEIIQNPDKFPLRSKVK